MTWLGFVDELMNTRRKKGLVDENKSNRRLLGCIPTKIAHIWVFLGQVDVSWQMFLLVKRALYMLKVLR